MNISFSQRDLHLQWRLFNMKYFTLVNELCYFLPLTHIHTLFSLSALPKTWRTSLSSSTTPRRLFSTRQDPCTVQRRRRWGLHDRSRALIIVFSYTCAFPATTSQNVCSEEFKMFAHQLQVRLTRLLFGATVEWEWLWMNVFRLQRFITVNVYIQIILRRGKRVFLSVVWGWSRSFTSGHQITDRQRKKLEWCILEVSCHNDY